MAQCARCAWCVWRISGDAVQIRDIGVAGRRGYNGVMSEAIAFDTHRFVKNLTASGFTEAQAEALAEEQVHLLNSNLATKSGIQGTNADLERVKSELEVKIEQVKSELEVKIEQVRTELEVKIRAGQGGRRNGQGGPATRHRKGQGRLVQMDVDRVGYPDGTDRDAGLVFVLRPAGRLTRRWLAPRESAPLPLPRNNVSAETRDRLSLPILQKRLCTLA